LSESSRQCERVLNVIASILILEVLQQMMVVSKRYQKNRNSSEIIMTKEKIKSIKAVSLISGGLDSLLSTKLLIDQGIHVEGINFLPVFVSKAILMLFVNKKKISPRETTLYGWQNSWV
jgi:predicted PP-loop superfamily ATPase